MKGKSSNTNSIRDDLSPKGRAPLKVILARLASMDFIPGDPSTYLGYKECCVSLGAIATEWTQ